MIVETEFYSNISENEEGFVTIMTADEIGALYESGENILLHFPYSQEASDLISVDTYMTLIGYEPDCTFYENDYKKTFMFAFSNVNIRASDTCENIFKNRYPNMDYNNDGTLRFYQPIGEV